MKALPKHQNASLQEITALQTFEALLLHISLSWVRGITCCFYCLVVRLLRLKSLLLRGRVSQSLSLSIHLSHFLTPSCPPLPSFKSSSKYRFSRRYVRERQRTEWWNRERIEEPGKPFVWPLVLCTLHLTQPDLPHLDDTICDPSSLFSKGSLSLTCRGKQFLFMCHCFCWGTWRSSLLTNTSTSVNMGQVPSCWPYLLCTHHLLDPGFAWYPFNLLHSRPPEGFILVQFAIPSSLFKEFPTSTFFLKLLPVYQMIDVFRANILKLLFPMTPIYWPLTEN